MLDLFAESSDEEDEKDSRKACELRRVGGPWRRFSSRKAAAKAFPGADYLVGRVLASLPRRTNVRDESETPSKRGRCGP